MQGYYHSRPKDFWLTNKERGTEWVILVILVIMQLSGGDVVPREQPSHFLSQKTDSAGSPKKNKGSCECVLPGPGEYS